MHHFDILTENGYQTCVCEINYRKGTLIGGYWLDEEETPLTEDELDMVADICGNTIWRLCKHYNEDTAVDEAYDRWKESRLNY